MLVNGDPTIYSTARVISVVLGIVESKVSKVVTGFPLNTVSPALYVGIIPNVDGTRSNHPAFITVQPAGDTRNKTAAHSFEYTQGVASGLDPARPGWL